MIVPLNDAAKLYAATFTPRALRYRIESAATNGLDDYGVVIRLGRRILIDLDRFELWLRAGQPPLTGTQEEVAHV